MLQVGSHNVRPYPGRDGPLVYLIPLGSLMRVGRPKPGEPDRVFGSRRSRSRSNSRFRTEPRRGDLSLGEGWIKPADLPYGSTLPGRTSFPRDRPPIHPLSPVRLPPPSFDRLPSLLPGFHSPTPDTGTASSVVTAPTSTATSSLSRLPPASGPLVKLLQATPVYRYQAAFHYRYRPRLNPPSPSPSPLPNRALPSPLPNVPCRLLTKRARPPPSPPSPSHFSATAPVPDFRFQTPRPPSSRPPDPPVPDPQTLQF